MTGNDSTASRLRPQYGREHVRELRGDFRRLEVHCMYRGRRRRLRFVPARLGVDLSTGLTPPSHTGMGRPRSTEELEYGSFVPQWTWQHRGGRRQVACHSQAVPGATNARYCRGSCEATKIGESFPITFGCAACRQIQAARQRTRADDGVGLTMVCVPPIEPPELSQGLT